jgi:hypothetical protein
MNEYSILSVWWLVTILKLCMVFTEMSLWQWNRVNEASGNSRPAKNGALGSL